jgi:hypothetical protein
LQRARQAAAAERCCEAGGAELSKAKIDAEIYVATTERRFKGVRRCC